MDDAPPRQSADHQSKQAWLNERLSENRAVLSAALRASFIWSWVRFLTFVMMPIGASAAVSEDYLVGGLLIGFGLIGFLIAVRLHTRVRQRLQLATLTEIVLEESATRLAGGVEILISGERPDAASESITRFLNKSDDASQTFPLSAQEIVDIDVFGTPLSLFGMLNRTSTPLGARSLADALERPLADRSNIETRQAAVQWLADHPWERIRIMAAAAGMRALSAECDDFCGTVAGFDPLPQRDKMRAAQVWGAVASIGLAIVIYRLFDGSVRQWEWIAALMTVSVNVSILRHFRGDVLPRIRPWLSLDDAVGSFAFLVNNAVDALPGDGPLARQRDTFTAANEPAALPALQRIMPFAFLGLAGLMHTIVNYVTLWDVHVVLGLDRAVAQQRSRLRDAFIAVGEMELLASLAAYAWETPGATFPEVEPNDASLVVDIREGRHPLIPAGEAVSNSVQLGEPICTYIITGSNMSGKSTFLRMTACNVVLAQIGSAVPAQSMRLTPLRLMTDLRIRDDLARHESYFLAEVRQVKRMVEATARHEPILALVDEPFRGTNSAERVAAAVAVVRSLTRGGGLHMVATHDEALTALADNRQVANFHFAESIDSAALVFDYRIHEGPSQTRNALRVLEMEGYPQTLIDEANEMARRLIKEQER